MSITRYKGIYVYFFFFFLEFQIISKACVTYVIIHFRKTECELNREPVVNSTFVEILGIRSLRYIVIENSELKNLESIWNINCLAIVVMSNGFCHKFARKTKIVRFQFILWHILRKFFFFCTKKVLRSSDKSSRWCRYLNLDL